MIVMFGSYSIDFKQVRRILEKERIENRNENRNENNETDRLLNNN